MRTTRILIAMAVVAVAAASLPASALSRSSERKVEASIALTLTPPSEGLPQTEKINLFVPQRFRDAGAKLPFCKITTLERGEFKACPKGSLVGNGTSLGYTILGGNFVPVHLTLTIFNGPHASLLTWVEARTPIVIETVVVGVITKPSGYGQQLSFTIPHPLLEPIPGAPGWLQTLNARLTGKAGWLRSSSCPEHPWSLGAELGYTNGQDLLLQTQIACV